MYIILSIWVILMPALVVGNILDKVYGMFMLLMSICIYTLGAMSATNWVKLIKIYRHLEAQVEDKDKVK
ncbi:hypothetical protein [Rodentibacter pneumotropicus]|uniref:Transmembrane protein n=1 Tax=Rodentibacter pneumotropicus TaxID=758 RepID=A0A4S2Q573_9PAST|nr:hypothetical protein [Rodentibacter pneumotropicus]THA11314.1 hypothetical protein D3M78_00420 [Rodentibacter pneumotropicus]